jgi:hypothetical protein
MTTLRVPVTCAADAVLGYVGGSTFASGVSV